jgi:hypothetical protein
VYTASSFPLIIEKKYLPFLIAPKKIVDFQNFIFIFSNPL